MSKGAKDADVDRLSPAQFIFRLDIWRKLHSHWLPDEADRQLVELRDQLQSLSQEAVREEALEDIPNEVCQAGMDAWNNTFGSPYTRYAAIYRAMQSALKREPNAAAQASPSVVPAESNLEFAAGPAPAEPVAEMVKRLNEAAREFARDLAGVSILCGEAAALLSKLGQGWVPVKNRSANYPAAKHLGEWDIIERERADGKLFSFTLPPLPPLPGASDE